MLTGMGRRGVRAFLLPLLFVLSSQPALAQDPPSLSIADASVTEGDRSTHIATMEFTVTLDPPAVGEVTVDWSTSDGTARHGSLSPAAGGTGDYRSNSGTLTFLPGDTSKTVRVTVYGDNVDEPDETFTVVLSDPSGDVTIERGTATGTIEDADDTPTVTLKLTPDQIGEDGGVSTVTATLSNPSSRVTTVRVEVPDSPDYTLSPENPLLTIPARSWDSTGVVTITAVNNDDPSDNKTVTVSGMARNDQALTGPEDVTLTIIDDDGEALPSLSIDDSSAVEGELMWFTVRLSRAVSYPVTVRYTLTDETAREFYDYDAYPGTLTFDAGETRKRVFMAEAYENDEDEPDKTFTVTLSEASGATIEDGAATGTIIDDDGPPDVTLVLTPASISEDGGVSTVTATRKGPLNEDATVTVRVTPVAPAVAGNYTLSTNTTLTIAAGRMTSTGTVTITAVDNNEDAPDKTVTVSGTAANSQGSKDTNDVTLTITDDDGASSLSIGDTSVTEGDTGSVTMTFTVTLSPAATQPVTVDWATSDGTAEAGTDYTMGNGSLRFDIGEDSKTFTVTVTGDEEDEEDETFTVTLSNASGDVTIVDDTATGTITDDDDTPSLSIADASVTEGDKSLHTSTMEFTVTLNPAAEGEVTVNWSTSDDTAEAGTPLSLSEGGRGDYRSNSGTLTFLPGDTSKTVRVTVHGDNADEPDETFTVALSDPSEGVTIERGTATGTIFDADDTPTVTLKLTPDQIDEDGGVSTVTATLSNPSSEDTTVTVSVPDSEDYMLSANADLTIPAGSRDSTGAVTITAVDNNEDAPDETVTVSGTADNDQGVTAPQDVTLTIIDDDGELPPSLSIDDLSAVEGQLMWFTVRLSRAVSYPVTVRYALTDETAREFYDYDAYSGTLTFDAGETEKRVFMADAYEDDAIEESETFTVTLSEASGATIEDGTATGTIFDGNSEPLPKLSIDDSTGVEGEDLRFTVRLSRAVSYPVTVRYTPSEDGTARDDEDYVPFTDVLTFEAGETRKQVLVARLTDDVADEPDETFTVTLSYASGATIEDGAATGTIFDNDGPPNVTLALDPISISEDGGASTVTATRKGPLNEDATVTVRVTPVAPAVAGDYTLSTNTTLTIPSGATTSTGEVTITAVDNNEDAPDKTVTVSGTAENSQGSKDTNDVTLTITDDEGEPSLSIADASVAEGAASESATMTFTVTLSRAATPSVTVDWATSDGTAQAGTDYTAGNGSLTFGAGEYSKTFTVTVTGDDVVEPDETFTVTLSNASGATITDATGTGTITDDDGLPSLSIADASVTEGARGEIVTMRFTVTLSPAAEGEVTVNWWTLDRGTARPSNGGTGDYEGDRGILTFHPGVTSRTVRVTVYGDDDDEPDETFPVRLWNARLGNASQGVTIEDAAATGTIKDDDDSPATGAVTITGTPTEGETLTADTSGIADTDGLDNAAWVYQWVRTPSGGGDADISGATDVTYVPVFADVGATLKVKVTVTDDEGHEATFTSAATVAVAAASRPSVTVVSDGDVTEGSPAVFTLTRTGDTAGTLDVAYAVTASGDFGATTGADMATFLAGSSTVQVSVATTDDSTHEAHGSVTVTLTADTGAAPAYVLGDSATATVAVEDDDDSPATGSVTVTGTATEGETLSADTSGLTDGDGLDNAAYVYQWVRTPSGGSDADISGATGATYVPAFADAGATLKVKVTVTDDEGHEATFTSAPTSAVAALPRPSVTVVSGGDVTEGSAAVFTLTRTGDLAEELDVAYEVTATGDFGAATGADTATFLADSSTVQVSVGTTGDGVHEAHGSVTVTLTADTGADPAYLLGDSATATAAVEDDDDSPATGSVTVTGTPTEGETLTANTSGLTDADGLDAAAYVYQWVRTPSGGSDADISGATSQTYVPAFADAGATLKVKVTVTDDEGHEATFTSAPTSAVAAASRPSVTVVSDGDVTEGSPAVFTLTRTGDLAQPLDVDYTVTATGEFGAATGASTATFLASNSTVQVSVVTTGDGAHEAHGSVTVTLTADTSADPAYLLGGPSAAMAAVEDDDDSPATGLVTITTATTFTEGETLTADTSGLTDADGLADAAYVYQWVRTPAGGSDADISGATGATYVPVFADAGATLKVRVTVTDDEGHEATFESAATATVEATARPSVTVASDGDVTEGSPAVFTLTRTGDLAQTLDVAYTVTASGDFGVTTGASTATFLASNSTVQVSVATTGDNAHEAHGSVTVTLTEDTGADPAYLLGDPSTATAAVEDDDDSPATGAVTITGTPTEGETLTADTSGLTDADGLADTDYVYQWVRTPAGGGDADISGATSQTYVPVFADAGATLKVKVTVTDDEGHEAEFESAPTSAVAALPRPSVTVASDGDVTEGDTVTFTLTRTGDPAQTLDVAYEVAATGDFGAATGAGTATFLADSATVQVSVATTGDGAHEAHGSVTLTLTADTSADPAYLLGDSAAATAAVEDDDDSPATGLVTITTATTFTEGETLTADTSGLTDADGLADAAYVYQWVRTPAGGSDADISGATGATYVPVFADAGATLKVRVTVTDDEGHEATFESAATATVEATARPSVTVASDGDVTEGSPAVFTLTRTGDLAQTLDVAYTVTASGDFGVTTGASTATFLANNTTAQVSVATTGDSTHETHGSVTLTLTTDTGADPAYLLGAPSTATAAVRDDDDSPATGSVTVTTATTFTEGETLTADTSGLTDADGLADAAYAYQWVRTPSGGSDANISGATSQTYVPVFADAGATLKVKVTVTDDEGHEASFTSAPTSAVAAASRPSVTVASDGDVTEGSPVLFTLTRTGNPAQPLDVAYAVTATGDFGVTTGASTATFLANNTTAQVSVATTGDSAHEAHGSVTVTLTADTGADPAYLLGAPSTATAAVRDDDNSPASGSITVTGTATEGETLTADTSGLTDADGLADATYTYQWVRTPDGGSDEDISGATGATYVPVFADAGATLKVKVTVTDDEGHQATFTSAPTSAVAAASRPSVTVASDGDVTEGSPAVFTLTRTGDPAQTLDVAYTVTATGDFGVTPFSGTATFPANSATVQVSVATTGDGAHEAHGSVTVTLTTDTGADPAYLLGAPSTATAAVRDDDDSSATGSVTVTGTATEGETLTADTSGLTDADGLANAVYAYQWVRTPSGGSDADISGATGATYVPVFADTGATLKVRVTVTDDEGHQAAFTSTPTSAVATAPRPSVTVASDGDVTEGSPAVFTLTRTGDLAQTLDVAYAVTASRDFGVTPFSGTATFPANSATVQVSVATTGDGAHEAHGSVTVTLTADTGSDPAYLLGAPSTATAAVEDDDDSPATGSVTITTATKFTEGETLTADTSGLTDADGLADAAYAYQWVRTPSGGGDADISGATSKTYVPVFADAGATLKVKVTVTDDEGHQATFTSAPTAAVAAAPRPSVTVVSDGDVTEGDTVTFTLTRTGDPAGTLDVAYEVTATGDFGVTTGASTATFLANNTTAQVSVATTGDSAHEAHGSVTVTLTTDTGADPAYLLGAPSTATAAVRDDDDSPAIGDVTVTTAATFTEGETLTADTSGLTDADGLDNAAYAYQWVRTPSGGGDADISGATSKTYVPVFADTGATLKVRVTVTDDEGHEATFTSVPTLAVAATPRPSVTVVSDGGVTEGDTVTFTLTRTGDLAQTLDVPYAVTATGDFGVTTGASTATFSTNSATVQVTVATTGDDAHEAHGSVTLTLTADTGADPVYELGAPSTATAAVRDDDDSPAIGDVTVTTATTFTEGETLTADTSDLTDADGLANAAYTYQWVRTPSGGSDGDISGATSQTYVPVYADAGARLKVRVTVTDDEGHEAEFESAPTSAVAAASRPSVTVVSAGDVTEGDTAVFTLTRTGDLAGTLDVAYEVAATGDFGAATGTDTATFLANSSTVQVSVATTGDDAHEAHGSVTVTLTADTGADPAYLLGAPSTATAAIRDDDDSSATGSVMVTTATTFTEGETLSADTSGLTDADGLADAAWAYQWVRTPSGGSDVNISGATSQTYVPVFADAGATLKVKVTVTDDEGHEATFESAATATVEATARPSVTVASDGDVTEGSPAVFTLTRTGNPAQPLDVAYAVTATGDFGAATGTDTATFLANSSTVQVTVATTGDGAHEAHGSVTLTLTADTSADPTYLLGDPSTATAVVEDDDDSPATGSVTITGTPTEGETLSADTSGLTDTDGLDAVAYAYQWVRTPSGGGDADISGATSKTYVPVFADAGATLKVKVTVTDDEGHEATFESAATATVEATARPSVTVASDGDVTEGSPVLFTLTRTGDLAQTLDVAYTVTASGDFGVTTGASTATFLASNSTVQVSVATTGDNAHEAHGTVTVTLTTDTGADPAYLLGAPSTATAAVRDDDDSPATGSVTVTTATTFTEGETLTADTSGLTDADGLANAAYTYQWVRTPAGGSDANISGATSQTYVPVYVDAGARLKVRVTVTDDEGHEAEFESAPTSAVTAAVRPSVTVVSGGDVTEGDTAVFTLTRTGDLAGTLDVAYEVAATGGFGVTTGAGTATFLANSSAVQVTVATTGDGAHEAHGSVTVTLTADTSADPAYLLGAPSTATAVVEDDDDSPATGSVTVTTATTFTEGETLTADTSGLTDADGLADADYAYQWVRTPSGGSDADISGATGATYVPVFADAGATLKVRVTVTDDEGHQATFESAATATVEALPRPSVTVASDGDVTEGSPVLFTLTRTGNPAQPLDVAYAVTATGDFGAATGTDTATFLANSSTVQVTVATTGDGAHEAHGSVTVTLTADTSADPTYLLGDPSTATAVVEDDDDSPATGSVTITGTPTEGETLSADTSGLTDADGLDNAAYTYQWVRTPSGGGDADISGATSQTYTPVFADAGATLKVKVTVTDDEGHEASFTSAPTSAVAAASRPSVTVVSGGDVTEGSAAVFTLTRTGDTAQTLDVAYEVAATGGFGAATGTDTATFPANSATVQVSVATTGDDTHEAHGSVTLTLTADTSADPVYELGVPSTATAAVRDDDNAVPTGAVTIDDTTPVVGETLTADASNLDDPDGLTNRSFTWQWLRVSGGTATEIAGATSASYTVAAVDVGSTLKVRVAFTDDDGTGETVESAPTNAAEPPSPVLTVAAGPSPVTEGTSATFTVTRTAFTSGALTAHYRVSETGDAVATSEEGAKSIDFADGETGKTLTVATVGDGVHEADSVVTVTLVPDAAYDLGPAAQRSASVTVADDDNAAPTGTVTIDDTTPVAGQTLSADMSGVNDPDGLTDRRFTWQWLRVSGGTAMAIAGATSASYTAVAADIGSALKVRAGFTDDDGTAETVESAPTAAVGAYTISVTSPRVTEGDDGAPLLQFALTRSETGQRVELGWRVSTEGTARAVTDFDGPMQGTLVLRPNTPSRSVYLQVIPDVVDESDETVVLEFFSVAGTPDGVTFPATVTGTILDDDTSTLSIAPSRGVDEGDTGTRELAFTVSMDNPSDREVTVAWDVVGGTAESGTDYTAPTPALVTFPALSWDPQRIVLGVIGDTDAERHETVAVELRDPTGGAALGTSRAEGTIRNDDGLVLSVDPPAVAEGDSHADGARLTFRLTLSGQADTDVTVDYRVDAGAGTATAGADFKDKSGTVRIKSGRTFAVVKLGILEDTAAEPDETVVMVFENPRGAVLYPDSARVMGTILNDDLLPVTVVPVAATVTEGEDAAFTLTRPDIDIGQSLAVSFTVADPGGVLARSAPVEATIAAGETEETVSLATVDDGVHEADSTVTLTLTASAAYALGAQRTAEVTVLDDDDSPATGSVAVTGTAREGETLSADVSGIADADGLDNGAFAYQWVRTPSGGSEADLSGATGATYVPVFADVGATLKVRVTVTDDEGHEATFESAATSAVAALPRSSVTVASDGDVTEGETVTFTLTRAGDTAEILDVAWETTASGDFGVTTGAGTATFPADGATVRVSVPTTDDNAHEAHGSVTLTLTPNPDAYDLGAEAAATAAVRDDDNAPPTGAPTIDDTTPVAGQTLSADTSGVGDPDGLTDRRFTWQWLRVSGGTATAITGATSARYTVAAADVGAALKVRAGFTDDGGASETVESAPTSAVGAYTIAVTTPTVTEGDGGLTILQFAVIRSETAQRVKLGWRLAASSTAQAGKGKDFAGPTQGTLDFPRGMTTRFVVFQVLPDFIDESDETVTLELFAVDGTPAGVTFPPTVTGTILDDDTSTVSVAPSRGVDEGDAGVRELAFTVSMDHPSDREVTVAWDVGGTAESGADYLAPTPALVTFPALSWEPQRITFDVIGDTDVERNETVAVELRDPSGGAVLGTSRAEGTIRNDDGLVVSVDPPEVAEGDSRADRARLTFRLTLSGQADTDVMVDYRVDADAGTATAGADFKDKSGTVRIKSGRTFAVVKLGILEDTAAEPDETVVMVFENPRGAVLDPGSGRVTGTILDDDLARVTVAAEAGAVTEGEDAVFVLRRAGDASAPLTVAVEVSEAGRVLAGTAPASVTFGESEAQTRLRVATSDDSTAEADGRVTATVTAGPGYTVDAGTGAGTAGVDVLDNDAPVAPEEAVTLWSTTMTVADLGGWVGWVGASGADLADPDWSEDGVEYALELLRWFGPLPSLVEARFNRRPPLAEELTLHAGGLTLALAEGGSGQNFAWSSVEGEPWPVGEEVELRLTRTVADEGHDGAAGPGISVADAQVHESAGTPLAFRVTLAEARTSAVSVRYATSDGSATAGADYVAASGVVRFEAGETVKTVHVAVLEDAHDEGEETMTLTLSSPFGAEVSNGVATGTIVNTDAMPRAWLGRFGRTVAGQVVDAVEARMTAVRRAGVEVSIAGRHVGAAGAFDEAASRGGALAGWFAGESGPEAFDMVASRDAALAGGRLAEWFGVGVDAEEWTVSGRALLAGTSFARTEGTAESGFVSVWGRGVVTDFDGRDGELSVDGEVATGLLGADWARADWAAGLMVGHSQGEGSYRSGQGAGTVSSSLTGLYPWGRRALNDRVTAWGVAGYGEGTLTLEPEGGARIETDMDLAMAAAGLRGVLVEAPAEGGFELAAKTDGLIVRSASDGAQGSDGGTLEAASAKVTRLRLGLEGTRAFRSEDGWTLTPSFGLGVRHDGGDAETGFGVEVGAGVAYAAPSSGVTADLQGRGLLGHEASGFREVGLSGSLAFDPSPSSDRGPSLSLSQTVGASATGDVEALYGRDTMAGLGGADAGAGSVDSAGRRRLEARAGYGVSVFGGRFTGTPELGFGLSESGRDYRLGWRLTPAGGNAGAFEFSVEATRREAANGDGSEHGLGVRATIRW